jgi:hypothetical protein
MNSGSGPPLPARFTNLELVSFSISKLAFFASIQQRFPKKKPVKRLSLSAHRPTTVKDRLACDVFPDLE